MNITAVAVFLLILAGVFLFKIKVSPSTSFKFRNSLIKHRDFRINNSIVNPANDTSHFEKKDLAASSLKNRTPLPIPEELELFSLVSSPKEIPSDLQRSILENLSKPHPLLTELSTQISSSKQLNNIIKKDPELVAKVIKSANSPAFGLKKPITNINHAINYLGLNQVHTIATQFALKTSISFNTKAQSQAYERIWTAGFIASAIALELSQNLHLESAGELATICQLNYLGDLAVIGNEASASELFIKPNNCLERTHYIQTKFNAHQATLAALVANSWDLPRKLQDSLGVGLMPLVNKMDHVAQHPITCTELLVCYISCRIAELLVFGGKEDVIDYDCIDWLNTEEVEFYYTGEQLKKANLEKLNDAYSSPEFKRKLRTIYTGMKS